jgi:hypothetical protein
LPYAVLRLEGIVAVRILSATTVPLTVAAVANVQHPLLFLRPALLLALKTLLLTNLSLIKRCLLPFGLLLATPLFLSSTFLLANLSLIVCPLLPVALLLQ